MTHFIYQPRSGDRVFADHVNGGIHVIRWGNGCRHVVGGIELSWHAASAGNHWRTEAKRMASLVVARCGGIAWDTQGAISLVVPTAQARFACEWMDAACRAARCQSGGMETLDRKAQLLLAGWEPSWTDMEPQYCADSGPAYAGPMVVEEQSYWVDESYYDSHPEKPRPEGRRWNVRMDLTTGAGGQVVVASAPGSWGQPVSATGGMIGFVQTEEPTQVMA